MMSTAAAWGPLSHQLENVRILAGLRRIVIAWQDPNGEWKHVLRCREDMVPQAEAHLLEDLFHVYHTGQKDRTAWPEVMQHWHAERGGFETFKSAYGAGFFAAFCEAGRFWPEHTSEWMSLVLPALVAALNETDRNRTLHAQRQAVLESALSLSISESEQSLLLHATRLARRLFTADLAACLTFEADLGPAHSRPLAEDPQGTAGRILVSEARWPESLAGEGQSLLVVGHPGQSPGGLPVGASVLAVPFRYADSKRAVLALRRESGGAYSPYDQFTLSVFCRQMENVLEKGRLLSRLQAANRELTTTQAQLVESARLQTLGEVASSVAHDFNNVLGALLGRVQLLQHAASDAGIQAALGKMERVIAMGEDTVKRLQDAARSRRVDKQLTLDALVRDVYSTTESVLRNQAQIHDRKVAWLAEFMPTATVIEAAAKPRAALRQLLSDLSTGAPANSAISLRTRRQDGRDLLTFTVALDRSDAAHPFDWQSLSGYEVFSQVMQQAGATLSNDVHDNVSTLVVCIAAPHARSAPEEGYRKGLRVLVVDDDQDVRDVLSELLITDGHAVTTASDGAEALQRFGQSTFDIVFTDLGMPGISGWQVAEQIKRESPGVPVVMVTGWGHQIDPAQIERSGVDRVLTKPFQWLKVLDTLQVLVPQNRA